MFHREGPSFLELARQALSSTEGGYDLLARKFDRTPFRTPDAMLDALVPHLGSPRRALDLCCGTGAGMRMLRPHVREEVVGVDFSAGMLREAERRLEEAPGEARLTLLRADALALPFKEELDLVTCFGALGHFVEADEGRLVASVHRALEPGGRFLFLTSERPPATSPALWAARGFNAAMRVRNAVWRPKFIMYYLTFLWPDVQVTLDKLGFDAEVVRDLFPPPYARGLLVVATKR